MDPIEWVDKEANKGPAMEIELAYGQINTEQKNKRTISYHEKVIHYVKVIKPE